MAKSDNPMVRSQYLMIQRSDCDICLRTLLIRPGLYKEPGEHEKPINLLKILDTAARGKRNIMKLVILSVRSPALATTLANDLRL